MSFWKIKIEVSGEVGAAGIGSSFGMNEVSLKCAWFFGAGIDIEWDF